MSSNRQLLLGLFFLIVLSILGYFTLFMSEFSLFKEAHPVVVHFQDANGLRQGDAVLVAGIRRGRVKDLVYDPDAELERRITVNLLMDQQLSLRDGFTIQIEDATLLGGKQIYIDPGLPGGVSVSTDRELIGSVAANALSGLGEIVTENREAVGRIVSNVDQVMEGMAEGRGVMGRLMSDETMADSLSASLASFQTTADNAAAISDDLRAGKGTLGKLLSDDELAGKLEEIGTELSKAAKDISAMSADLAEGKGTLGKLISDEAMAADVTQAIEDIRSVVAKINAGEGTLGKLVTDDSIANHVEEIVAAINRGDGTLGKLISNDEIYDKLSVIADNLASASATLTSGGGTLGRLMNDDSLYLELERAVGIITRSLEEYREAAPISTFTSVLFGAF